VGIKLFSEQRVSFSCLHHSYCLLVIFKAFCDRESFFFVFWMKPCFELGHIT
jgi:hypothetical protein